MPDDSFTSIYCGPNASRMEMMKENPFVEERGKFLPNMEYMVECGEVRLAESYGEELHERSY